MSNAVVAKYWKLGPVLQENGQALKTVWVPIPFKTSRACRLYLSKI